MIDGVTMVLRSAVTTDGDQNFLGAKWVPATVTRTPARLRRPLALWLLSLSPHYFYERDRAAEAERNRASRERLVADVLAPHLRPDMDVVDYGCGPGFLAAAVARRVRRVDAVDISRGVLACAEVLNPAPNVRYLTPDHFAAETAPVDLAYSFAVAQHLTDAVLGEVVRAIAARLRPGGTLVLHVVVDAPGWRTESDWRADTGLAGRIRLRHGLNCFTRTEDDLRALVTAAGLTDVTIEPMADRTGVDDDVTGQHLLTARRPADQPLRPSRKSK